MTHIPGAQIFELTGFICVMSGIAYGMNTAYKSLIKSALGRPEQITVEDLSSTASIILTGLTMLLIVKTSSSE